jgi:hypothetical protein
VHRPTGDPPVNRFVAAVATEPAHWDPRGAVRASIVGGDSTTWRVVLDGATAARAARSRGPRSSRACSRPRADGSPGRSSSHRMNSAATTCATSRRTSGILRRSRSISRRGHSCAGRSRRSCSPGAPSAAAVLLASAERARRPGLLFAPADPLGVADANRALERAGIPWRFGAPREGPAPLRGGGLDGTVARHWYPLIATPPPRHVRGHLGARVIDTLVRVGGEPWAVAGDGYVLIGERRSTAHRDRPHRCARPSCPGWATCIAQRLGRGAAPRYWTLRPAPRSGCRPGSTRSKRAMASVTAFAAARHHRGPVDAPASTSAPRPGASRGVGRQRRAGGVRSRAALDATLRDRVLAGGARSPPTPRRSARRSSTPGPAALDGPLILRARAPGGGDARRATRERIGAAA